MVRVRGRGPRCAGTPGAVAQPKPRALTEQQVQTISRLEHRLAELVKKSTGGWSADAKEYRAQAKVVRDQINSIDPGHLERSAKARREDFD